MRNYTARMFLEGVNIWYFHVFSWLDISNVDLCENSLTCLGRLLVEDELSCMPA